MNLATWLQLGSTFLVGFGIYITTKRGNEDLIRTFAERLSKLETLVSADAQRADAFERRVEKQLEHIDARVTGTERRVAELERVRR